MGKSGEPGRVQTFLKPRGPGKRRAESGSPPVFDIEERVNLVENGKWERIGVIKEKNVVRIIAMAQMFEKTNAQFILVGRSKIAPKLKEKIEIEWGLCIELLLYIYYKVEDLMILWIMV